MAGPHGLKSGDLVLGVQGNQVLLLHLLFLLLLLQVADLARWRESLALLVTSPLGGLCVARGEGGLSKEGECCGEESQGSLCFQVLLLPLASTS